MMVSFAILEVRFCFKGCFTLLVAAKLLKDWLQLAHNWLMLPTGKS